MLQLLSSAVPIVLITLALTSPLHAGLTPCGGTYTLGSANSNDLLPGGGSSAGCEQVDKQFSNFGYTPGGTTPVTGSNVDVTFIGSNPTSGLGALFGNPFAVNPTWNLTSTGTSTSAVAPYNVAVDPAATTPPQGEFYAITAMNLSVNYTLTLPANPGDTITVFEYFCGGGASFCTGGGAATGGINLASATAGYIVFTVAGNGSGGDNASESICFNNGGSTCTAVVGSSINFATTNYFNGFQDVYTASNLALTSGGASQVGLNYFTENYFENLETPEPATFSLMGTALAGLGLLGFRKRK
jgi:hypothetical protein